MAVLLEYGQGSKIKLPALHIAAKKDDVGAAKLLLKSENPDKESMVRCCCHCQYYLCIRPTSFLDLSLSLCLSLSLSLSLCLSPVFSCLVLPMLSAYQRQPHQLYSLYSSINLIDFSFLYFLVVTMLATSQPITLHVSKLQNKRWQLLHLHPIERIDLAM